jgi:hypothetical protein
MRLYILLARKEGVRTEIRKKRSLRQCCEKNWIICVALRIRRLAQILPFYTHVYMILPSHNAYVYRHLNMRLPRATHAVKMERYIDGETFGECLLGKQRAWSIKLRRILRRRDQLKWWLSRLVFCGCPVRISAVTPTGLPGFYGFIQSLHALRPVSFIIHHQPLVWRNPVWVTASESLSKCK